MAETFTKYPTCIEIRDLGIESYTTCFRIPDENRPELYLANLDIEDLLLIRKLVDGALWDIIKELVPEFTIV